jgi:uncharacterized membrane protein
VEECIIILVGYYWFFVGIIPEVNWTYRAILLFASPSILAIACLFIFLDNQDKIKERLIRLEEGLRSANDLVEIRLSLII